LTKVNPRWLYALWLIVIGGFAVLHALNLRADFPNHTPWIFDFAKYTDEGWYGNAAVRAHLFGSWYLRGDFNPAPAVPVWPFLEWLLFFITGVSIQAARGLSVAFFFANLVLSYLLLRARGPRWTALLALTLVVTSPFLYCFSRLAILEPMLTAFTLCTFNIAVRLPRLRRPVAWSIGIGLLFTLTMLTKTTAVFLTPALGWIMILPLWGDRKKILRCTAAAAVTFAVTFGGWMALVVANGLLPDYEYLFFINKYVKPSQFYWPLLSLWWSFHGGLWIDSVLVPLAGVLTLIAVAAAIGWSSPWARKLLLDPVFGASILASAGYIAFMTYQNHPQPRYFAFVAFFCFYLVAIGAEALLGENAQLGGDDLLGPRFPLRWLGGAAVVLAAATAAGNAASTLSYALHPEYTYVTAAGELTRYIDQHPNGNRLLVFISGDDITMMTHLPTLCDDLPTADMPDLVAKLTHYKPGWWATWNDIDPGTLEDLHTQFSLEQVASFHALDNSDRNVLVLFKLHPLPGGEMRTYGEENLQVLLPGDKIQIPIDQGP
jgi:4-amino-4-deoxy-L-arabinose transferase-like glycosyltransferase